MDIEEDEKKPVKPIYPVLENSISKNIDNQRAQKLVLSIQSKQDKLKHYEKIYNRWRKTHKIIRILNLTLASLIGGTVCTLGIISTSGIIIPVLVLGILGGYGTIETTIMEGMNIGLIKKKKERFKNKIDIIKDGINKMYFYYEKAREDNEISVEEFEGLNKLMKELEDKLNSNEKIKTNGKIDFWYYRLRRKYKRRKKYKKK